MASLYTRRQGIQLAYPWDENRFNKWGRHAIIQPKYNGNRCRIKTDGDGKPTLLSSEANELVSVPHINAAVQRINLPNIELDGELYVHGWSKQQIDSVTGRTKNLHEDHEQMQFWCFDLIDQIMNQTERLDTIYRYLITRFDHKILNITESTPVSSVKEVEVLLQYYTSEGYEGIIARQPTSLYVRKRSTMMMKWKPRESDSYLIVGSVEAVSVEGIPMNTLGALICETDGEQFKVGAGKLNHNQRKLWWENRHDLPGRYALIKYQELTERGIPVPPVLCEITDIKTTL